jgi:HNH endonuclease
MPTKPLDRLMFVQGNRCFFCAEPLPKEHASVEHLLASSNGGANADDNCVACCKAVNALFGSMSLKEKFQVVLNQKGKFQCPNRVAMVPRPPAPLAESVTYTKVYDNLKARGSSRPRVEKTLLSTVAAVLKGSSGPEISRVIARLKHNGVIDITATKVTYKF